jgi:hypothetical protein
MEQPKQLTRFLHPELRRERARKSGHPEEMILKRLPLSIRSAVVRNRA